MAVSNLRGVVLAWLATRTTIAQSTCISMDVGVGNDTLRLHFTGQDSAMSIAGAYVHDLGLFAAHEKASRMPAAQRGAAPQKSDATHLVVTAIPKTGSRTLRSILKAVSTLRGGQPRLVNGISDVSSQVWSWLTAGFDFTIKLPYFGVESAHDEDQMNLAVSSIGATDATALRVRLLEAMRVCSSSLKSHMETALIGAEPTIYIDHVHFLGASANIAYVAVVREPLRWLSSHFYFHRDSEMPLGLAGCNETDAAQPLSLVEAVRIAGSDDTSPCAERIRRYLSWFTELGSAQTRILCGVEQDCFDYTPGQEDDRPERQSLALALDHLMNDYAVVGVLEKWRLTLRVLEAKLPHFFCGALDYAATRSSDDKFFFSQPGDFASRPLNESFPPDIDRTVRRWLANDFVLYATADARLEQLAGRYLGRRLDDGNELGPAQQTGT